MSELTAMAPATHDLVLASGETIAGLWDITDDDDLPYTPNMVTALAWREQDTAAPIDWSPYLANPSPGTVTLTVPGDGTTAMQPGRWTAQVWGSFEVDTVPDRLLVVINLRMDLGLPGVADRAGITVDGLVI